MDDELYPVLIVIFLVLPFLPFLGYLFTTIAQWVLVERRTSNARQDIVRARTNSPLSRTPQTTFKSQIEIELEPVELTQRSLPATSVSVTSEKVETQKPEETIAMAEIDETKDEGTETDTVAAQNKKEKSQGKKTNKKLTTDQKKELRTAFDEDPYPSKKVKEEFAKKMEVQYETIDNWYSNERARRPNKK